MLILTALKAMNMVIFFCQNNGIFPILTEFIMEIDCFVKSVILLESKEGLKN